MKSIFCISWLVLFTLPWNIYIPSQYICVLLSVTWKEIWNSVHSSKYFLLSFCLDLVLSCLNVTISTSHKNFKEYYVRLSNITFIFYSSVF